VRAIHYLAHKPAGVVSVFESFHLQVLSQAHQAVMQEISPFPGEAVRAGEAWAVCCP